MSSDQRKIAGVLIIFSLISLSIGMVSATGTNVNITFRETVFQNVTFAENFDLVENRTYSLISGNVTVENPSPENVFDIYLRIINTENLGSDFIHIAGREGFQRH